MSLTRRLILAFALMAGLSPAFAQAPPPVPALPDAERRTSYSIVASTCACAVNFALYGDSTDYGNWLEVFINGVLQSSSAYTITSPTGPLGNIPRPITDAVLTFNTAQTGTVQIVGARRPRRVSQFTEGRGVAARDLNQALTDIIAQNRETWDKTNDVTGRALLSQPGNTMALLPLPATCAGNLLGFDSTGLIPVCLPTSTSSLTLPSIPTARMLANISGTTQAPAATTATAWFDNVYCNTVGFLIVRFTSAWTCSQSIPANVLWWGADKTGSASSSAAISTMQASGAQHFLFPCGTYLVTSSIQPASFQTWEGEAFRCVLINQSGLATTSGIFDLTADTVQEVRITNFGVGAFSNGRGLLSRGNFGVYVKNFICAATLLNCIDIQASATNSYRIFLDNIEVIPLASGINNGINIGTAGGANTPQGIWITNSEIANTANCGIEIFAGGGITIDKTEWLTNVGDGLCTFPSAGQTVKALFITNSFADTNGKNGINLSENGGSVQDISFANVWSASNTLSGLQFLTSAGSVTGVNIVGGRYVNNKQHGIVMNVGDHISLAGVQVEGNSQQGSALFDGINIAGATHVQITGGISGAGGFAGHGGSNLQRYGINIGAAADFDVISGMDVCSNVTGGLNYAASGSHNVIRDNPCYSPVGLTAGTSTGTTGSTITAGPSPETDYITQSGTFNAAVKSGATTLCTVATATVPCVIELGPNESYSVTWGTTQPTYSKFVH